MTSMTTRLDSLDLSASLTHDESEKRILKAQRRLTQLRLFCGGLLGSTTKGPGLIVLFEGFDAAGKGGAIRRSDQWPGPSSRSRGTHRAAQRRGAAPPFPLAVPGVLTRTRRHDHLRPFVVRTPAR